MAPFYLRAGIFWQSPYIAIGEKLSCRGAAAEISARLNFQRLDDVVVASFGAADGFEIAIHQALFEIHEPQLDRTNKFISL
jgi:hypothetical protein